MPLTDLYRHAKFKVGVYSGIRYRLFHSILNSLEISTLFIILIIMSLPLFTQFMLTNVEGN